MAIEKYLLPLSICVFVSQIVYSRTMNDLLNLERDISTCKTNGKIV
uniref:Uncharacterized protein n=1 Tax=Anguilla anguilla TaxID=7936 RepID=A0A0E9SHM7_ANGAN